MDRENPKRINLHTAEKVLNAWKSYMFLWHRACHTSNADTFFDAAKAAKWFEFNLRKLSLWQAIRFVLMVRKEKDKTYTMPTSDELLKEIKGK